MVEPIDVSLLAKLIDAGAGTAEDKRIVKIAGFAGDAELVEIEDIQTLSDNSGGTYTDSEEATMKKIKQYVDLRTHYYIRATKNGSMLRPHVKRSLKPTTSRLLNCVERGHD